MAETGTTYGVYDTDRPGRDIQVHPTEDEAQKHRDQLIHDGGDPDKIAIRRYEPHHAGQFFPGGFTVKFPAA